MPILPIIALVISCVICLWSLYVAWKKKKSAEYNIWSSNSTL